MSSESTPAFAACSVSSRVSRRDCEPVAATTGTFPAATCTAMSTSRLRSPTLPGCLGSRPQLRHAVRAVRDADVLRLHVEVEAVVPAIAADAARLHSAKRRGQMPVVFGVHPHHAGVHGV